MNIGFAMCGSFCTHKKALDALRFLVAEGHSVTPFVSDAVYTTDTRFGTAEVLLREVETLTGTFVRHTVKEAEPYGPKYPLDLLIVLPLTGNTLSKIAAGQSDSAVSMVVKAHLRCDRPTLFGLSTNDGMSANLKNLAVLLQRKSVYFLPMKQDDPVKKPHSLVADFGLLPDAVSAALRGEQLYPLFLV